MRLYIDHAFWVGFAQTWYGNGAPEFARAGQSKLGPRVQTEGRGIWERKEKGGIKGRRDTGQVMGYVPPVLPRRGMPFDAK